MKKMYQRPMAQVVKLQEQGHLMNVSGQISGYGQSTHGGFSQPSGSRGSNQIEEDDN